MEIEFINAYIVKQRSWIDELTAKWLLAETRVTVLETQVGDLTAKIEKLESDVKKTATK